MKFDEIFVRLNEEFSIFYYPDFCNTKVGGTRKSLYMQTDRIHPNASRGFNVTNFCVNETIYQLEKLPL